MTEQEQEGLLHSPLGVPQRGIDSPSVNVLLQASHEDPSVQQVSSKTVSFYSGTLDASIRIPNALINTSHESNCCRPLAVMKEGLASAHMEKEPQQKTLEQTPLPEKPTSVVPTFGRHL